MLDLDNGRAERRIEDIDDFNDFLGFSDRLELTSQSESGTLVNACLALPPIRASKMKNKSN